MDRQDMVRIDNAIYAQYLELMKANSEEHEHAVHVKRVLKSYGFHVLENPHDTMTAFEDALDTGIFFDQSKKVQSLPADRKEVLVKNLRHYIEKYHALGEALGTELTKYHVANANYGGWNRFYAVSGGHIHKTKSCSTCNKGQSLTQFIWLVDLAGLTEQDAVKEYGPVLCTVCFPSAPVKFTEGTFGASDKEYCKGSGTMQWVDRKRGQRYGTCGVCGKRGVSVASRTNMVIRKHVVEKPTE